MSEYKLNNISRKQRDLSITNMRSSNTRKERPTGSGVKKIMSASASGPRKLTAASGPGKLTAASGPGRVTAASGPRKLTAASGPGKLTAASGFESIARPSASGFESIARPSASGFESVVRPSASASGFESVIMPSGLKTMTSPLAYSLGTIGSPFASGIITASSAEVPRSIIPYDYSIYLNGPLPPPPSITESPFNTKYLTDANFKYYIDALSKVQSDFHLLYLRNKGYSDLLRKKENIERMPEYYKMIMDSKSPESDKDGIFEMTLAFVKYRNNIVKIIKEVYLKFVVNPNIVMPYLLFVRCITGLHLIICNIDSYLIPNLEPGIIDTAKYPSNPLGNDINKMPDEVKTAYSIVQPYIKVIQGSYARSVFVPKDLEGFKQVDVVLQTIFRYHLQYSNDGPYNGPLNSLGHLTLGVRSHYQTTKLSNIPIYYFHALRTLSKTIGINNDIDTIFFPISTFVIPQPSNVFTLAPYPEYKLDTSYIELLRGTSGHLTSYGGNGSRRYRGKSRRQKKRKGTHMR